MTGISIGIIVAGYTLGLWGYCLVNNLNVPFSVLFQSTPPPWPPPVITDPVTLPSGAPKANTANPPIVDVPF